MPSFTPTGWPSCLCTSVYLREQRCPPLASPSGPHLAGGASRHGQVAAGPTASLYVCCCCGGTGLSGYVRGREAPRAVAGGSLLCKGLCAVLLSWKSADMRRCGLCKGAARAGQVVHGIARGAWQHLFCVSVREAAFCEISFLFFYF